MLFYSYTVTHNNYIQNRWVEYYIYYVPFVGTYTLLDKFNIAVDYITVPFQSKFEIFCILTYSRTIFNFSLLCVCDEIQKSLNAVYFQ